MRRLKTRTIWIITVVLFLITIGVIVAIPFSDLSNTMLIVIVTILFILLTFLVQYASYRSFSYKKRIKYNYKYFQTDEDISTLLHKEGFKERLAPFGSSFLLIRGTNAYKVVIVRDIEAYFNPTDEDVKNAGTSDKRLDKCNKFIAFEIFENNEAYKQKIYDMSIQGDRVYYTAYLMDGYDFTCINYLEPSDIHKENYTKLTEMLHFVEKSANIDEEKN